MARFEFIAVAMVSLALMVPSVHAVDEMIVTNTSADPGATGVLVTIAGTNDDDFQGMSVAATYETAVLDCTGVSVSGTVIESIAPGGVPEYMEILVDDAAAAFEGTAIVGIIFDLNPVSVVSVLASPTTPQDLCHLVFDVEEFALPAVYDVDLVNGLGSPPIDSSYSSFGFTVLPTLTSGTFTVNNNFSMYMNDLNTAPGVTTEMLVFADHPYALQGFQVSLAYDNTKLSITEYADFDQWHSGLDSEMVDPPVAIPIEFFNPVLTPTLPSDPTMGYLTLSAILDFLGPPFDGQEIPAGVGTSLVRVEVTTDTSMAVDECTTLSFVNVGEGPDYTLDNLLVVLDGQSVLPIRDSAEICIQPAEGFRRGDANTDQVVNIADAIYIIQWSFVDGPIPPCFSAADSNDDSLVNIADVIYIISWNFIDGPEPPPPGPFVCGDDPTPGTDCALYPTCL